MNTFDDTSWLLEQWGRWAYINRRIQLGYPTIQPFTRQVTPTRPGPAINDLVAGEIDHAVADLCKRDPEMGEAVARYYLNGVDYRLLGERMGISTRRASGLVQAGVSWVGEVLDSE
jgi:hypothetical protein